jgi:hypothetical protein
VPRRLTLVLLLAVGLTACGGGDDKKDAQRTVREFVTATNKRDANKLCDEVFSEDFIEQATGATGDRAKSACKQQFKQLRGLKLRLVRFSKTEIDGDEARVSTIIETQNQPQPRVFKLTKEDGDWRLAGGSGG